MLSKKNPTLSTDRYIALIIKHSTILTSSAFGESDVCR